MGSERSETVRSSTERRPWGLFVALLGGVVGAAAWVVTMASAPRHSNGPHEDMGDLSTYVAIVFLCVLVGGYLFPIESLAIAAAVGLPGLVLSPWTAPRGDGDGLWILILPYMGLIQVLLFTAAAVAALARLRIRRW